MTETTEVKTEAQEVVAETTTDGGVDLQAKAGEFKERYAEVLGKINTALDGVDWNQMGRIGKAAGILIAVIVAQILIKGVLDTINLLPVVPGLLELLGLVVVGSWSWNNLRTSTKREELVQSITKLRQEYLG
ncbi:MAG: CAAD domain-containing protein [Cyanobacteriota bacterium]|nr:CAAD domain-containing protein [Cyanobacteriota bacterium]|tara:strand:- start:9 stop:404 length:396 start_codon:yes stop_codon:yes gene_type:complete